MIRRATMPDGTHREAHFSDHEQYRYRLSVTWGAGPVAAWCMLNPSTADEMRNDPTVERCERRSRALGCGGMIVVNLFAYRATDPADMRAMGVDAISEPGDCRRNDLAIMQAAAEADIVICGWGNHGTFLGRSAKMLEYLRAAGYGGKLHAILVNAKSGQPAHPLYLSYDLGPRLL